MFGLIGSLSERQYATGNVTTRSLRQASSVTIPIQLPFTPIIVAVLGNRTWNNYKPVIFRLNEAGAVVSGSSGWTNTSSYSSYLWTDISEISTDSFTIRIRNTIDEISDITLVSCPLVWYAWR